MARRFLDRKVSSRGIPSRGFSDSMGAMMMTLDGAGTPIGMGTRRSTRAKKSSTVSSGSGLPRPTDPSIDLARIYRSIYEQQADLGRPPAYVLLSPRTCYEIQATGADWAYLGTPKTKGARPILMLMGIPVKEVTWMPDGIVVVTDNFEEDAPGIVWPKGEAWKKAFGTFVDSSKWATSTTDYKISLDPAIYSGSYTTTSTAPLTWWSDGSGVAISSGTTVTVTYEENPEAWADVIKESPEPDPETIYGKALERARAEQRSKK